MGDMGMFSGLASCEDCGAVMYLCRTTYFKPEQEYYICSTYRNNREKCTTHTIRRLVLEEIVLRHLREAIAYVKNHEDDFIREAADNSMRERDRELAVKKKALAESDKRIAELDTIIKKLYEDNATGKLTDERFIKLSLDFEFEQDNLITAAEVMRQELKEQEQKKGNVKCFIATTKKYTNLQELDDTILREFVDRIEISATDKWKKKEPGRKIHIVYNFIGAFDFGAVAAQTEANNETDKEKRKSA